MAIQPVSFLLGLGVAWALPAITRALRPLAVEAVVTAIALVDDGRRLLAEQVETVEDMLAEARARREDVVAEGNGHAADRPEIGEDVAPDRPRRRPAPGRRRS